MNQSRVVEDKFCAEEIGEELDELTADVEGISGEVFGTDGLITGGTLGEDVLEIWLGDWLIGCIRGINGVAVSICDELFVFWAN